MDILIKLIDEELRRANDKFPAFQSMHEAYGVMREELEEANDEFKDIKDSILHNYWNLCKDDKIDNKLLIENLLDTIEECIINNINELIQLAAMVNKAKLLNDKE